MFLEVSSSCLFSCVYLKVEFEGTLGKLSSFNIHNPKKLLNIKPLIAPLSSNSQSSSGAAYTHILACIERVYGHLITIDDLYSNYQQIESLSVEPEQQLEWQDFLTFSFQLIY